MLMKAPVCRSTNLLYVATLLCGAYFSLCWLILIFFEGQVKAAKFASFFATDYQGFLTGIPILTLYLISERFLPIFPPL